MAAQVVPAAVGEGLVALDPDHALGLEEGGMDVIHGLQTRQGQEGAGDQVDPASAHLVLGAGPGAGVENFHLQSQLLANLLEQVGVGAYQLRGILRVAPEIGGILGIAGGHQALALPGGMPQPG
ncbi:hypothetical protein FQZ97_1075430 [compost metagenome]